MLILTVLKGPDKGRRFELPDDEPQLVGRSSEALPLTDRPSLDLTAHITDRALDGLFHVLAAEEGRIRRDPLARTTELLRRVFGRRK